MTIGVTIAGKHSLKDLGMYLTDADIGFPEVRTNYVDVPGRDGQLDLSDSLDGEIHYQNRTISLAFVSTANLSGLSWTEFLSRLASLLHGQKVTLTFDGDSGWYYSGRGASPAMPWRATAGPYSWKSVVTPGATKPPSLRWPPR